MKYCKNCGKELDDGDNFCPVCGTKVSDVETPINKAPTPTETNSGSGLAVASLVLSIIALLLCLTVFFRVPYLSFGSVVLGILAIVFGLDKRARNDKKAKAGWIMGIIALTLAAMIIVMYILVILSLIAIL